MSPEVRDFLTGQSVAFEVHAHAPIVSFADAKAVLPFDPNAMVKGLAFRLPGGTYAIVGMRGASRADYKKIADALGIRRADLKAADADDLTRDLGMAPGGVVPLPINAATIVFDQTVLDLDTIFCGTGRTDTTLQIASRDLVRIADGTIVSVAKAPES